jgi:hypothetical protein
MTTQTWNTAGYDKHARFVTDLGMPVLALLAPKRGEHILDVGCSDAGGFEVRHIALIPRPTPLPGDVMGWLVTFAVCFTSLPLAAREDYLECVRERIKPHLCGANGNWTADYVRLRFEAHLLESSERSG